jgi:hypothetical protein
LGVERIVEWISKLFRSASTSSVDANT